MDWDALEHAGFRAAGARGTVDGVTLSNLRKTVLGYMAEAADEVAKESELALEPMSELLVVDRRAWVAGNVRTLRGVFLSLPAVTDARLVAWEGGLLLGVVARAVLAQYDPYRDALIVVYPNLGEAGAGDGLRWIVFHELTHLAQFRSAPWMRDMIVELGNEALGGGDPSWLREASRRLGENLPDLLSAVRRALAGEDGGIAPVLQFLPDEQRDLILRLHGLLTVLEGHATHVTDLVGRRLIPGYDEMQDRIKRSRRRPPAMRVVESLMGLEMKRQQYVQGRGFCDAVWQQGGAKALAPVWTGPEALPTQDELRNPDEWLSRVHGTTPVNAGLPGAPRPIA